MIFLVPFARHSQPDPVFLCRKGSGKAVNSDYGTHQTIASVSGYGSTTWRFARPTARRLQWNSNEVVLTSNTDEQQREKSTHTHTHTHTLTHARARGADIAATAERIIQHTEVNATVLCLAATTAVIVVVCTSERCMTK